MSQCSVWYINLLEHVVTYVPVFQSASSTFFYVEYCVHYHRSGVAKITCCQSFYRTIIERKRLTALLQYQAIVQNLKV